MSKQVVSKNSYTVVCMKRGLVVAYKGRRECIRGEHWFQMDHEDDEINRAVNEAIVSLDGTPSSGDLARAINSRLQGGRS